MPVLATLATCTRPSELVLMKYYSPLCCWRDNFIGSDAMVPPRVMYKDVGCCSRLDNQHSLAGLMARRPLVNDQDNSHHN